MARRRRRNDGGHWAVLGGVGLLLVVLAVGGAAAYFKINAHVMDPETLCPAEGPLGHVVVLVDKTDPLNFTQNEAFQVLLEKIITQEVAPGELVSVFALGEDYKTTAKPLIEICNPGDGSDKNALTSNVKRLKRQFSERFRSPLLAVSNELQAQHPADHSPLLEMIQLVSINGFRAHGIEQNRRLIIVSDMLHNTPEFSMYKGTYDYAAFSGTPYGRKMQVELPGVSVELHYVLNSPLLQTRRHLKFWEDYFSRAGAKVVAVRPMEG